MGASAFLIPAIVGKRSVVLSITHKLSTDDRSQFDVGQTSQASPHDFVAGRWIVGTSKIATESGEFDQIGSQ